MWSIGTRVAIRSLRLGIGIMVGLIVTSGAEGKSEVEEIYVFVCPISVTVQLGLGNAREPISIKIHLNRIYIDTYYGNGTILKKWRIG